MFDVPRNIEIDAEPEEDKNIFDTAEYMEQLLCHLLRDPLVMKTAKDLGLTPDDFLSSQQYGIQLYKVFASIALEVGFAPIDPQLFLQYVKIRFKVGEIHESQEDMALALWEGLYNKDTLNPFYFMASMKKFIKRVRQEKIKREHEQNTDRMLTELNKLHVKLDTNELGSEEVFRMPFAQMHESAVVELIGTGLRRVDSELGGLAHGNYGIIVGYSGGGKTALASNIARNVALRGKKVAYVSLEELESDIMNRFYAQTFSIPYGQLRTGSRMELRQKFSEEAGSVNIKKLKENLCLLNLKGHTPISARSIKALLDKRFEESGFIPELVLIDQLQFMEANDPEMELQEWQREKQVSFECDQMSHELIGGKNFGLWVLNQAKGKFKKYFNNDDIAGYKGIIQPADTVIGIGRESLTSQDFGIFSLKSRHSTNFTVDYKGELEFMRFLDPEIEAGNADRPNNDGVQLDQGEVAGAVSANPSKCPVFTGLKETTTK